MSTTHGPCESGGRVVKKRNSMTVMGVICNIQQNPQAFQSLLPQITESSLMRLSGLWSKDDRIVLFDTGTLPVFAHDFLSPTGFKHVIANLCLPPPPQRGDFTQSLRFCVSGIDVICSCTAADMYISINVMFWFEQLRRLRQRGNGVMMNLVS